VRPLWFRQRSGTFTEWLNLICDEISVFLMKFRFSDLKFPTCAVLDLQALQMPLD